MSIEGKKKALLNHALNVANTTMKLEAEAIKHHNYGCSFVDMMMRETAKATAITIANKIQTTPHQYFNADGKIDKRKQRRHDRKIGLKTHNSRLVRVNNGLSCDVAILDEIGVYGGDE